MEWLYLQKAASTGGENSAAGGGTGMVKSGRRRWGQTVSKTMDSCEESDPSETAASNSKKPSLGKTEEERRPKEPRPE